ncbi:pre-toxin TG domain-containing protein [Hydrogenophaga sp. BPS33]|uniref:pre-toxin TG domain-containing protein n=1 Tax=Hydrogenophaga sp. BPS33 TaxID=2651974 RepID=UPI00131FE00A|nr:pre-toxin TG domain-containing protein [Hydrogenophaga sp. BPS33]QHE88463.1 hypothetical protein F9K07_28070 [Hydrogenophaga sp. BPS33]
MSHSPFANVRRTVSQENARLVNVCGANCTAEDLQRIDRQMVALEQAGNLAEIAQRGVMTSQQAQQMAQLVFELYPGYGNAESFAQLITGQSSLTGEAVSRFWAAVGVIPIAGGVLKKVGEPSAEALVAVLKVGDAAKGFASDAGRVGSRINLSNEVMEHVIARHLSGKSNASQFLLSEVELRSILSSQSVVDLPIVRSIESAGGIRYLREFDAGRVIGTDRFNGNQATSVMTIMTDRFGNLVSTFPGLLK